MSLFFDRSDVLEDACGATEMVLNGHKGSLLVLTQLLSLYLIQLHLLLG